MEEGGGSSDNDGHLQGEAFAKAAASLVDGPAHGDFLSALENAAAGSMILARQAIESGWTPDTPHPPSGLTAWVKGVFDSLDDAPAELIKMMALAPGLEVASLIGALRDDSDLDQAERDVRGTGLTDQTHQLAPLATECVLLDITSDERARLSERIAIATASSHPQLAAKLALAGTGKTPGFEAALKDLATGLVALDPEVSYDVAEHALACGAEDPAFGQLMMSAAFRAGLPNTASLVEESPDDAAEVRFGLAMRNMAWADAGTNPNHGQLGKAAAGHFDAADRASTDEATAEIAVAMTNALRQYAEGDSFGAVAALANLSDRFDRLSVSTPLGITPHALGAAVAINMGDSSAAVSLCDQALAAGSGGQGERTTHELLRAYAMLLTGDFDAALELVRDGEQDHWSLRDRFLLAAVDAAIARRSGDIGRLKKAWETADPILLRGATSWILVEPTIELLAAGTRVGATRRIGVVTKQLVEQLERLPPEGPGQIGVAWLQLQQALANDKGADPTAGIDGFGAVQPADDRTAARVAAASAWTDVFAGTSKSEALEAVADQLAYVGDSWEASRILGQAALESQDPSTARALLDKARSYAVEPSDAQAGGLLALGLSEREAEVATLVAEGRTYKEVGAQLFVSPKTVEHHVAHIRRKIGASSRAEFLAAIREALA